MNKIYYIVTFSFYALFSINSFATTTPLDLHLDKNHPSNNTSINQITDALPSATEEPTLIINEQAITEQYTSSLNIAVASNFKATAEYIAREFSHVFGIQVHISSASTATLFQQIVHGAPFDLFLSADEKHVQLLMDQDRVEQQAGFVYAQGQLVFWQPKLQHTLNENDFIQYDGRLAIANAKFAPYGIAAQQTLEKINKWNSQPYVKGNNINQVYQFVESGNVPAGLVSYAAVVQQHQKNYFIISQKWYQPIKQVGIILNDKRLEESNLFRQFLLSDSIQFYIKSQGYN